MRILVTGGSGIVGRYVVRELLDGGHTLTIYDLVRPGEQENVMWVEGDLLSPERLAQACAAHDAIAHLAAIPNPEVADAPTVMTVNVTGTLNVFNAAIANGIPGVVYASTDSTLGFVFRERDFLPEYLPIDEDHPLRPQDPYGLSKRFCEEMAEAFCFAHPDLRITALRLCGVLSPHRAVALPERYRTLTEDASVDAKSFWVYVHAFDAAAAFRLALENKALAGFQKFFISADDHTTDESLEALFARFYPGLTLPPALHGAASVISNRRAREALGFAPRFTWRDLPGLA